MKNLLIAVMLLTVLLSSCSNSVEYGKTVSETVTSTVSTILGQASNMAEKPVVIEGVVGDVCPSGCWFFLHDSEAKNNKIYIELAPAGIAIPQKSSGKSARLSGIVKYDGKTVVVYGDGVTL